MVQHFVLAIGFGASQTGVAVAEDLSAGMIDRFRSLPGHRRRGAGRPGRRRRAAQPVVVGLMIAVGATIEFRFHGRHAVLAAIALAIATGLALSWLNLPLGLAVRDPESAGLAGRVRAGRRKGEGPRSRVIGLWRRRRRQRILAPREMVCHGNGHT